MLSVKKIKVYIEQIKWQSYNDSTGFEDATVPMLRIHKVRKNDPFIEVTQKEYDEYSDACVNYNKVLDKMNKLIKERINA